MEPVVGGRSRVESPVPTHDLVWGPRLWDWDFSMIDSLELGSTDKRGLDKGIDILPLFLLG